MVIGPWLSPRAREIIVEHGMGYADFVGNARIALSGTFIKRAVAARALRAAPAPAGARGGVFRLSISALCRLSPANARGEDGRSGSFL